MSPVAKGEDNPASEWLIEEEKVGRKRFFNML